MLRAAGRQRLASLEPTQHPLRHRDEHEMQFPTADFTAGGRRIGSEKGRGWGYSPLAGIPGWPGTQSQGR